MTLPKKRKQYNYNRKNKYSNERKPEFDYDGFEKKHQPMKDRFFSQNYEYFIDLSSDEPMYAYQLDCNDVDYNKLHKMLSYKDIDLEFEPEILSFIRDGFTVRNDWIYFDSDMKSISRKLPDVLIRVKYWSEDFPVMGDGDIEDIHDEFPNLIIEKNEDYIPAGVYYSINGQSYTEEARVIWPEFDYSMLVDGD